MSLPFGPPYPVSPLIRGFRHGLFILGVFYGLVKQQAYNAMEAKWREEEKARQVIRDKENAILREKIRQQEAAAVKLLETGKLFDDL